MTVQELINALMSQPMNNTVVLCAAYENGRKFAKGEVKYLERDGYNDPFITFLWTED